MMKNKRGVSRRSFLVGSAAGLGSTWLASHWPGIVAAQEHAQQAATSTRPVTFEFFTPEEALETESVAAQIIPTDDTPGAREAGVVHFIDRALTTFDRDKQTIYTKGLKDLQTKTRGLFPGTAELGTAEFSGLQPAQQIQVLQAMEKTEFFPLIRLHTILGFFANPEYGGNQHKAGWNLIGFEDKFNFEPPFGFYDGEI